MISFVVELKVYLNLCRFLRLRTKSLDVKTLNSSVVSEKPMRMNTVLAVRGPLKRDLVYRLIRASSHVSSYTVTPLGALSADLLQRSYSGYGVFVLGAGGVLVAANRVVQAQAWARVLTAPALDSPRDVSFGHQWTVLLSNAFSFLTTIKLQNWTSTRWRRHVPMPVYAGVLEAALTDIEAHAAGLAQGEVIYIEAPGSVLERVAPVLAILMSRRD